MRFLVDRCAGRRLADWLRGRGHDVLESRELGVDPGDIALLRLASDQQRILVSIDNDFGTLIFLGGLAHSGLIRLPDAPAATRVDLIQQVLARYTETELAGAVVTVTLARIRYSRNS